MMRFLTLPVLLLLATPGHAETYLDQVKALFDKGTKPSLAQFNDPQVWEGRCVCARDPDRYFDEFTGQTFAHLIFHVDGDEVVGKSTRSDIWLDQQGHATNPDYYVTALGNEIARTGAYFPRSYENDDFNAVVQWRNPQKNMVIGIPSAYTLLRSSTTAAGKDIFVARIDCDDPRGCHFFTLDNVGAAARGQSWGYCYFTDRLQPVVVAPPPTLPVPPPPPPRPMLHS